MKLVNLNISDTKIPKISKHNRHFVLSTLLNTKLHVSREKNSTLHSIRVNREIRAYEPDNTQYETRNWTASNIGTVKFKRENLLKHNNFEIYEISAILYSVISKCIS